MLQCRSERYRLYPTPAQIARIEAWSHALRALWNLALEQRLMAYGRSRSDRKYPTGFDQIHELKALRAEAPWLADVPRDVCAQLLLELDIGWQRCFRKLASMPRYKSKARSERAALIAPKDFSIDGAGRQASVVFPKLGSIRAVIHRQPAGVIKTCALVKDGEAWFACIAWKREVPDPLPSTKPAVGIDRGVVNLLADSDGRLVTNLRMLKQIQKRLSTAERRVSHKRKGSENRERAKRRVVVLHQRARRQRAAVLHRESKGYAENQGLLVVERLDIVNMTRSARGTVENPGTNIAQKSGLNRAIRDSGWGKFLLLLRYKAVAQGARVVEVRAAYSSQECFACKHIAAANRLSQSEFKCVECGHHDHADTNAAKVILRRGTHGVDGCGGDEVTRPKKQQLRVARRATRHVDPGSLSSVKAPAFMPG